MSPPNRSLEVRVPHPRAIIPDQQGAPSKLRLGGPASSQTERSIITEVSPSRGTFAAAPLQDVVLLRDVFSTVEHLCHVERFRHVERSRHVGTFAPPWKSGPSGPRSRAPTEAFRPGGRFQPHKYPLDFRR